MNEEVACSTYLSLTKQKDWFHNPFTCAIYDCKICPFGFKIYSVMTWMLQWYSMVVIYTHKNVMKLITGIDQINWLWRLVSCKTVEFYFSYHFIIIRSLKVSKPFSWAFLCHLLMHEVFTKIARIGIMMIPDRHKTVSAISWWYHNGVIWLMTLMIWRYKMVPL